MYWWPGWSPWAWVWMAVMMAAMFGATAWVVLAVLRRPRSAPDDAEATLAERYARGDIDADEFRRMRKDLQEQRR